MHDAQVEEQRGKLADKSHAGVAGRIVADDYGTRKVYEYNVVVQRVLPGHFVGVYVVIQESHNVLVLDQVAERDRKDDRVQLIRLKHDLIALEPAPVVTIRRQNGPRVVDGDAANDQLVEGADYARQVAVATILIFLHVLAVLKVHHEIARQEVHHEEEREAAEKDAEEPVKVH